MDIFLPVDVKENAEDNLAGFERVGIAWPTSLIDDTAARVRQSFDAACMIIGVRLDRRIKKATRRAHRISAKQSLREFENMLAAWRPDLVDILAENIRKQFSASGVELTKEGKLPGPYEQRLEIAIVRAKKITLES